MIFLGDSITDGWRLDQYFTGKPYHNRGISGQITGQMLGRTKPDVTDLRAAAVVVLGGTNDLARGVPDAAIRNNLEAIGMLAASAGVHPILASILPVNDYHEGANPRFRRTTLRKPITHRRTQPLDRGVVPIERVDVSGLPQCDDRRRRQTSPRFLE